MVTRQVQQPLVSYRGVDGAWRHALSGEQVDVDPKDLDRFDKLNFANSSTPPRKKTPPPAPKKKAAAQKAVRQPTPRK